MVAQRENGDLVGLLARIVKMLTDIDTKPLTNREWRRLVVAIELLQDVLDGLGAPRKPSGRLETLIGRTLLWWWRRGR